MKLKPAFDAELLQELRAACRALQDVAQELRGFFAQSNPSAAAVTIDEATRLLCCGPTKVYELLKQRALRRAPRVGRKVLVTRASIDAMLAGRAPRRAPTTPWTQPTRADVGL